MTPISFPNRSAFGKAPFGAGGALEPGSGIYQWSLLRNGLAGQDADWLWRQFQAACETGEWGAGFSFNGLAFPDAVVLDLNFQKDRALGYKINVTFAGTPSPTFTPNGQGMGPGSLPWLATDTYSSGDTDPISCIKPVGIEVGDLLIWCIMSPVEIATPVPVPPGFTFVSQVGVPTFEQLGMFYRIADGTEPPVFTVAYPGGTPYGWATFLAVVRNADPVAPFGSVDSFITSAPLTTGIMELPAGVLAGVSSLVLLACAPTDETMNIVSGFYIDPPLTQKLGGQPEVKYASIVGGVFAPLVDGNTGPISCTAELSLPADGYMCIGVAINPKP